MGGRGYIGLKAFLWMGGSHGYIGLKAEMTTKACEALAQDGDTFCSMRSMDVELCVLR